MEESIRSTSRSVTSISAEHPRPVSSIHAVNRNLSIVISVCLMAGLFLVASAVPSSGATLAPSGLSMQVVPPTSTVTPQPPPEDPPQEDSPPQQQPPPKPSYPPLPSGSGEGRRVVYSNAQQRVWLVEADGTVTDSWLVSGRKGVPRVGTYSVFSKSRHSSAKRGRLRMEYMVRFARGRSLAIGFHSIPTSRKGPIQREDELGQFRSAGCVRQKFSDAEKLWHFAPVGTKVVVTDSAPPAKAKKARARRR